MDEHTTFAAGDWRSHSPLFEGETFRRNLRAVHELERWAGERGHTVSQLAIAWTLANPAVDAAIVGARHPTHIEDSVRAADVELTAEDLAEIDHIMAGAVTAAGPSPESV